jgi:hypothetical protein
MSIFLPILEQVIAMGLSSILQQISYFFIYHIIPGVNYDETLLIYFLGLSGCTLLDYIPPLSRYCGQALRIHFRYHL